MEMSLAGLGSIESFRQMRLSDLVEWAAAAAQVIKKRNKSWRANRIR